jgi:hypothetical protein
LVECFPWWRTLCLCQLACSVWLSDFKLSVYDPYETLPTEVLVRLD